MHQVPNFLRREGDSLIFNQDGEFIFYVPEIYFDRKIAEIDGEYVNIMGVLDYAIFEPSGRHTPLRTFQHPTIFTTRPSAIEKSKNVTLTKNSDTQDYRLLKYKKNDVIVNSVLTPKDVTNAEKFYAMFLISGRLPNTVRYDKIQEYFIDNAKLNGFSYGMNLQMFGIIISEAIRAKNNLSKPFRLSGSNDMTNYQTINIKDLPKYISPYAALTSENWDNGVVGAITNTNTVDSPMEKLLMGTTEE